MVEMKNIKMNGWNYFRHGWGPDGKEYTYPLGFTRNHYIKHIWHELHPTAIRMHLIGLLAGKKIGVLLNASVNGKGGDSFIYFAGKNTLVRGCVFDGAAKGQGMIEF
jgi:hypothetical protein